MRARIWGCRGSIAAPGPSTVRYGGNTSCVEVQLESGPVVILDAGTGMRELGDTLLAQGEQEIHVLLSHLHLDHLQGLAFFAPLYRAGYEIHLWGPPSPMRSLADRIGAYMSDPLFPVRLDDVASTVFCHDAPFDGEVLGSAEFGAAPVMHRGPTVGYRIEDAGRSLVYLPDHEPALGADFRTVEVAWVSGYALAQHADVLLHDAQYTEEEFETHRGWGHSSVRHVVEYALVGDVEQLVLFHHDPAHSDSQLDDLLVRALELWGDRPHPPVLAYEGMEIDLGALPSARTAATRSASAV